MVMIKKKNFIKIIRIRSFDSGQNNYLSIQHKNNDEYTIISFRPYIMMTHTAKSVICIIQSQFTVIPVCYNPFVIL